MTVLSRGAKNRSAGKKLKSLSKAHESLGEINRRLEPLRQISAWLILSTKLEQHALKASQHLELAIGSSDHDIRLERWSRLARALVFKTAH